LYYTPRNPASFGGVNNLHREALKQIGPGISIKEVREFAYAQLPYVMHFPVRRRFNRYRQIVKLHILSWVLVILTNSYDRVRFWTRILRWSFWPFDFSIKIWSGWDINLWTLENTSSRMSFELSPWRRACRYRDDRGPAIGRFLRVHRPWNHGGEVRQCLSHPEKDMFPKAEIGGISVGTEG